MAFLCQECSYHHAKKSEWGGGGGGGGGHQDVLPLFYPLT